MAELGTSIPGILGQQDFDLAVANWVGIINAPNEAALQESFTTSGGLITGVGFELVRLAQLVSTTGAARIKARFIVRPLVAGGKAQFQLALFAVDALDARVSSYYVTETLYTNKLELKHPKTTHRLLHKNQVSNALVKRWLHNWNQLTKVGSVNFESPYGPLRGYTFDIAEFAAIFHSVRELDDHMFRISFVLHDFYQADPSGGNVLANIFALALHAHRKHKDGQTDDGGVNDDPEDPTVLDMGQPCPPHC